MKCDECGLDRDEKDIRYNPKWKNHICRQCFFSELFGNYSENKALGSLLEKHQAEAWLAANSIFDKLMKKKEK